MSNRQNNFVTGLPKILLRVEGLLVLAISCYLYGEESGDWGKFLLLFFVPDLSLMGYLVGKKIGALLYNLLHSYILPLIMFGLAYKYELFDSQILSLIWFAHIGFDRMLGFGLKYSSDFKNTHLGKIGIFNKKQS